MILEKESIDINDFQDYLGFLFRMALIVNDKKTANWLKEQNILLPGEISSIKNSYKSTRFHSIRNPVRSSISNLIYCKIPWEIMKEDLGKYLVN